MNKLVSTYIQSMVESSTPKDEHEEGPVDEYLFRFHTSDIVNWLYRECVPISPREVAPPEDTGIYG